MFNKLNQNRNKRHLLEDEPPEKKLVSDADLFIKSLAEKQRTTKTSLVEQLQSKKEFYKSTELVPLTSYTAGSSSLEQFVSVAKYADEVERLKSLGLSSEDIELHFDSKLGSERLKCKHKNFNEDVIAKRLEEIEGIIESNSKVQRQEVEQRSYKTESVLSTKPESIETKLLKFALQNQHKDQDAFPRPIDSIKEVEENLMLGILTQREIKKIRKKARSLNNQIESLSKSEQLHTRSPPASLAQSLAKDSKWDLQQEVEEQETKRKIAKTYSCKPQKWYTISNGEIVQIDKLGSDGPVEDSEDTITGSQAKLTIEEIKKLPKFENYEAGEPSDVLYLKNLASGVSEDDLNEIIGDANNVVSVKLMKGKMRGQAFVNFKDVTSAEAALTKLNGFMLKNRPVIAHFGKCRRPS